MKSFGPLGTIVSAITRLYKRIARRKLPAGIELRPEPTTTRLNRRALVVLGAVLVGVILAATATLVENSERLRSAQADAPKLNPAPEPFWRSQPDGVAVPPVPPGSETTVHEPPSEAGPPDSFEESSSLATGSTTGQSEEEVRRRRAYEAPPLVGGFRHTRAEEPREIGPACGAARTNEPAVDSARRILAAAQGLVRDPDPTLIENNQVAKREFLDKATLARDEQVNAHLVTPPLSPYEVTAGAVVPAVLVTGADSDLPGMLTARVRENVYDSVTGGHLLIPQGTVLTGVYDSVLTYGQNRLLVAWQRLIFPDGNQLNIGSMPGVDDEGAAGFEDRVDHHMLRVFGSAALLSVISGALQISQGTSPQQITSQRQDLRQTLAAALGQNFGEAASQMIRRNLNVQPSIEIRAGYRFHVFVKKDLVFPAPYSGA
ncbi:MAG TPA: TrbI/VirB10 family protein [Myxococcota bacterium]|nr:TrbI/VirB10 family protein [Myxococcota bacterium]